MIEVSTRRYENAHGRTPRGYGAWIFYAMNDAGSVIDTINVIHNYGEAKAEAIWYFRDLYGDALASVEVAT